MAASLISTALGLILTLQIALTGRPLRGTTLVGPWLWGVVSGLLWTAASLLSALDSQLSNRDWNALLPYAAAVSTCCPLVALLGARRPQGSVWQFVVATLLLILLVPAVQTSGTLRPITVEPPWSWFLLGLVGVALLNTLATRYWPAAIALALGQLVLLAPHLAVPAILSDSSRTMAGLALLIVAVLLYRWRARTAWQNVAWQARDPLDRLWLDFRDAFGTLWALRVQQRVNAAAAQFGWPVVLAWDGFCDRASGAPTTVLPPEVRGAVEHVLRTVLWRFMSESWIEARLAAN